MPEQKLTVAAQPVIVECFSCSLCELTTLKDCCDERFCTAHYFLHLELAHEVNLLEVIEFYDTHHGEGRVVVSYPATHPAPTTEARERAREITDAEDVRCSHGPYSGCARVHLTELRDRIAAALSSTPSDAAVPLDAEVQRRMDAVVEAAVEWHQSDADWFEKSETLSAAIESLLELRGTEKG